MAQTGKNPPEVQETWVHSWVGKIPWRRAWQPIPVFLPGESHGQRSLVGYSPWGHKELDTTEWLSTAQYKIYFKATNYIFIQFLTQIPISMYPCNMYIHVCLYLCVSVSTGMHVYMHAYMFHPVFEWPVNNYSNKHSFLKTGAYDFRETWKTIEIIQF